MKNKYIQWFCAEIFDNWEINVDVRAIYTKFRERFPEADQDMALDCMAKAVKIVGTTRNVERLND